MVENVDEQKKLDDTTPLTEAAPVLENKSSGEVEEKLPVVAAVEFDPSISDEEVLMVKDIDIEVVEEVREDPEEQFKSILKAQQAITSSFLKDGKVKESSPKKVCRFK
jgi:hypothetical protein